jgi:hypothetical protein
MVQDRVQWRTRVNTRLGSSWWTDPLLNSQGSLCYATLVTLMQTRWQHFLTRTRPQSYKRKSQNERVCGVIYSICTTQSSMQHRGFWMKHLLFHVFLQTKRNFSATQDPLPSMYRIIHVNCYTVFSTSLSVKDVHVFFNVENVIMRGWKLMKPWHWA